ncbi:hypothetical protein JNW90_17540 [Micromonospora sp. STR1s_5]|nr:hypothetical protein [Micromonospora sp. STR1s_5]
MKRYFFHLRTAGGAEITDDFGDELPDAAAAEDHAIGSAKDIVKNSLLDWSRASFEVYDDTGSHVVTVWFREALAGALRSGHRSPPDDQHA